MKLFSNPNSKSHTRSNSIFQNTNLSSDFNHFPFINSKLNTIQNNNSNKNDQRKSIFVSHSNNQSLNTKYSRFKENIVNLKRNTLANTNTNSNSFNFNSAINLKNSNISKHQSLLIKPENIQIRPSILKNSNKKVSKYINSSPRLSISPTKRDSALKKKATVNFNSSSVNFKSSNKKVSLLNKNKNKLEESLKVMVKFSKKTNDSKDDKKVVVEDKNFNTVEQPESFKSNDLYKILKEKREKKEFNLIESKKSKLLDKQEIKPHQLNKHNKLNSLNLSVNEFSVTNSPKKKKIEDNQYKETIIFLKSLEVKPKGSNNKTNESQFITNDLKLNRISKQQNLSLSPTKKSPLQQQKKPQTLKIDESKKNEFKRCLDLIAPLRGVNKFIKIIKNRRADRLKDEFEKNQQLTNNNNLSNKKSNKIFKSSNTLDSHNTGDIKDKDLIKPKTKNSGTFNKIKNTRKNSIFNNLNSSNEDSKINRSSKDDSSHNNSNELSLLNLNLNLNYRNKQSNSSIEEADELVDKYSPNLEDNSILKKLSKKNLRKNMTFNQSDQGDKKVTSKNSLKSNKKIKTFLVQRSTSEKKYDSDSSLDIEQNTSIYHKNYSGSSLGINFRNSEKYLINNMDDSNDENNCNDYIINFTKEIINNVISNYENEYENQNFYLIEDFYKQAVTKNVSRRKSGLFFKSPIKKNIKKTKIENLTNKNEKKRKLIRSRSVMPSRETVENHESVNFYDVSEIVIDEKHNNSWTCKLRSSNDSNIKLPNLSKEEARTNKYRKLHQHHKYRKHMQELYGKILITDEIVKSTSVIKRNTATSKNILKIEPQKPGSIIMEKMNKPESFSDYKKYLINNSQHHFNSLINRELRVSNKSGKLKNTLKIFKSMFKNHLKEELLDFKDEVEAPKVIITNINYHSNDYKAYINNRYFDVYNFIVAFLNDYKFNKNFIKTKQTIDINTVKNKNSARDVGNLYSFDSNNLINIKDLKVDFSMIYNQNIKKIKAFKTKIQNSYNLNPGYFLERILKETNMLFTSMKLQDKRSDIKNGTILPHKRYSDNKEVMSDVESACNDSSSNSTPSQKSILNVSTHSKNSNKSKRSKKSKISLKTSPSKNLNILTNFNKKLDSNNENTLKTKKQEYAWKKTEALIQNKTFIMNNKSIMTNFLMNKKKKPKLFKRLISSLSKNLIKNNTDQATNKGQNKWNNGITRASSVFRTLIIKTDIVKGLNNKNLEILFYYINDNNFIKFKEIFEKANIDIEKKNSDGNTLLNLAVMVNNKEIVKYLIDKDSDINSQNNQLNTPLHNALINKNFEIANILINKSANQNIKNINNMNPWELLNTEIK